MRALLAILAAAAAPAATVTSAPPVQTVLTQSGPWFVDYAATSCKLRRPFGTDHQRVWVEFQQRAPRAEYHMMLYGPGIGALGASAPLEFRLGDGYLIKANGWTAATTLNGIKLMRFYLGDPETDGRSRAASYLAYQAPGALAGATYLEIKTSKADLKFTSGAIQAAITGLNGCVDDLVRGWGLDPAVQRTLSRQPMPLGEPGKWLTSNDFPERELEEGRGGIVEFRLIVSAAGEPTGCTVQSGLAYAGFDQATCGAVMRRAHFSPALDAQGKPVASYYSSVVSFIHGGSVAEAMDDPWADQPSIVQ